MEDHCSTFSGPRPQIMQDAGEGLGPTNLGRPRANVRRWILPVQVIGRSYGYSVRETGVRVSLATSNVSSSGNVMARVCSIVSVATTIPSTFNVPVPSFVKPDPSYVNSKVMVKACRTGCRMPPFGPFVSDDFHLLPQVVHGMLIHPEPIELTSAKSNSLRRTDDGRPCRM